MNASNKAMGPTEWSLLLLLSFCWGASYFFSKVIVQEVPPLTIVAVRVAIGAAALNLLLIAMGQRMPTSLNEWKTFFVMGLLNNLIPFSLIIWSQKHIPSGLASILNATTPLFVVFFAHWLTRDERLTAPRFAGVLLGLAGVATLLGPLLSVNVGLDFAAQLAVLGAAVSYAFAALYARHYLKSPPTVAASGQVTASFVMSVPIALLVDQPWTLATPSYAAWGALLGMGLLSTALSFVIYFRILSTSGATAISLVTFLVPVSALLLGTFILGERLEPRHFAGMFLIAGGLAAIDGRPLRAIRRGLAFARPRLAEPLEAEAFQNRAACGQGVDK